VLADVSEETAMPRQSLNYGRLDWEHLRRRQDHRRTGISDTVVYLEVANGGPFIPDDAVPSLFEPFRRMEAGPASATGSASRGAR